MIKSDSSGILACGINRRRASSWGTARGETFSLTWSQYDEWGFGVDLYDDSMAAHLTDEAASTWVDVSDHIAWTKVVGHSLDVSFLWNDFGTGRPPCPEALKLSADTGALWIITADWERRGGKLSIQLGTDDLMVIFDEKFIETLGLFDGERGREQASGTTAADQP
jgi:hypothetical protein